MGQVSVTINGRTYRLSCEDGEEQRLLQLADLVNSRVSEFVNAFGQVGENRLLLLAALRVADELLDLREKKAARAASHAKVRKQHQPQPAE